MNEKRLIEANTRLVDEIRGLNYDIAMLESRIDKAINYINEKMKNIDEYGDQMISLNVLLNILKGDYYE